MKKRDYAERLAEDGRQRTDRGRSRQEPERHRLRRPGLHEGRRHQGRADRRRHAFRAPASTPRSDPYARPTFYYTNGEPHGLAKQFVDFTLGSGGQKIVTQVGFVPIR